MTKAKTGSKKSVKKDSETPTTTALSKDEQKKLAKAAAARWESITEELRTRRRGVVADLLQYRYDVGKFALDVMEDRAKELGNKLYGDRTIEQVSDALAESQSTIHSCMKFVRRCDSKELEYFKKHEWPWRAVSSIITIEDAKTYKQLKEKFEKGQFGNTDELKEAAATANAQAKSSGAKTERRGPSRTAYSIIKSVSTACGQISTKVLPVYVTTVKDFVKNSAKMETVEVDKMAAELKDVKKALEALKKMIEHAEAITGEAGI